MLVTKINQHCGERTLSLALLAPCVRQMTMRVKMKLLCNWIEQGGKKDYKRAEANTVAKRPGTTYNHAEKIMLVFERTRCYTEHQRTLLPLSLRQRVILVSMRNANDDAYNDGVTLQ